MAPSNFVLVNFFVWKLNFSFTFPFIHRFNRSRFSFLFFHLFLTLNDFEFEIIRGNGLRGGGAYIICSWLEYFFNDFFVWKLSTETYEGLGRSLYIIKGIKCALFLLGFLKSKKRCSVSMTFVWSIEYCVRLSCQMYLDYFLECIFGLVGRLFEVIQVTKVMVCLNVSCFGSNRWLFVLVRSVLYFPVISLHIFL